MFYKILLFVFVMHCQLKQRQDRKEMEKKKPYPHEMKKSYPWQRDVNRKSWMKDVWKGK